LVEGLPQAGGGVSPLPASQVGFGIALLPEILSRHKILGFTQARDTFPETRS
jgi:hypothetical protein